jgi:PEGA domain
MASRSPAESHSFDAHDEYETEKPKGAVPTPFVPGRRPPPAPPEDHSYGSSDKDALQAFGAEQGSKWASVSGPLPASTKLLAVALVIGLAIAVVVYSRAQARAGSTAAGAVAAGNASINSRPAGAKVTIDGVARGVTPLTLSLPAGPHSLELGSGADVRTIPLTIASGTLTEQYIELAAGAPAKSSERLEITSDPSGAQVSVDGRSRGTTPLKLATIGAGQHEVVVSSGDSRVRRSVQIAQGATASVFVSLAKTGTSAGWISIKSPIELQILERGKLVGTSSADQVMLPAGRHVLDFVNTTYGFRTTTPVQVQPGKTSVSTVPLPNGSLSVNALPWAEIWLDGKSIGTTPLANLSVPIGSHELIWRHPQLGERRQTVVVTTKTPTRVGMELGPGK